MKLKLKKPYYGWIIVVAGVIIMALSVGIVNNCFSLYVVPICDELGFSRKAGALMGTLYSIGSMIVAALSVKLFRTFPIKRIMQLSAVVLSVAYFCYSLARSLWVFYVITIIAACALWYLAYIPFAVILSNWFHKHTGFVIGMTYMGTGLGGMIFSPVVGGLIAAIGWRATFARMAIVMAAVIIPCTLLMKDKPSEMGLLPYGYDAEARNNDGTPRDLLSGVPFSLACRTAKFYLLAISIAMINFVGTGFASTFASYLSDIGYPIATASTIVAGTMASLAAGKISLGWLYDRLGNTTGTALSSLSLTLTLLASLFLPGTAPAIVTVIAFSLGFAFGSVAVPIISKAAFGIRDFSRVNGAFMTLSGITASFGPVFSGYICDTTGSYAGSYKVYAVLAVIFPIVIIICLKAKWKHGAHDEEANQAA